MMDLSDGLYIIAGLSAGIGLGYWLWHPFSPRDRGADDIEIIPPLPGSEPRFSNIWRQRGYDDFMLDGTCDPTRVPTGFARQEYLMGNDIARAESRKDWDRAMDSPEMMPLQRPDL